MKKNKRPVITTKKKKKKSIITSCNENVYLNNDKVRKETGLTENAQILMD
jgi:hypothetical protein